MSSNYTRRISLYINGKEVKNDIASIRGVMNKLVNTQSRMTIGSKEYVKAGEDIRKLKGIVAEHNTQLKATASGWDGLKSSVGGLISKFAGPLAAMFSLSAIIGFGKAAFAAFEQATIGNIRLLFALKGNTAEFQSLMKINKEYREKAGISGSALKQIETMSAATGRSIEMTQKLVRASVELAALTGGDLQSSYTQLNGTFAGNVRGLKRVDAEFGELTAEQLRNGGAVDLVLKKYTGFAERSATSTQKLSAEWKAFMVVMGESTSGPINWVIEAMTGLVKMFKGMAEWFKLPPIEGIRQERDDLNSLVFQIQATNTNQAERNRLIDELRRKYPEFLGNLKNEQVTNEELAKSLSRVNTQYLDKIRNAGAEETLAKLAEAQEKANKKLSAAEQDRNKILSRSMDLLYQSNAAAASLIENAPTLDAKIELVKKYFGGIGGTGEAFLIAAEKARKAENIMKQTKQDFEKGTVEIAESAVNSSLNATNSLANVSSELLSIALKTNDKTLKQIIQAELYARKMSGNVNTQGNNTEDGAGEYKLLQDRVTSLIDKKKDLMAIGKQLSAQDQADLAKYQKQLESIDALTGKNGNNALKEKVDKEAKEAEKAYKQTQDIKKQEIESSLSIMQEGYDKEMIQLTNKYQAERDTIVHELTTNKDLSIADKEILNQTIANLDQKYLDDQGELNKKKELEQLKSNKELIALQLEGVREGSAAEYKLKKDQLDAQELIDIAEVKETEDKAKFIKAIRDKYNRLREAEDKKFALKFISDQLIADKIALDEAETQKETDLKARRDKGIISERKYQKELLKLKKEFSAEVLKITIDEVQRQIDIKAAAGDDVADLRKQLAELKLELGRNTNNVDPTDPNATPKKDTGFKDMTPKEIRDFAIDQAQATADTIFQIKRDKNQAELDEKLSQLEKERTAELANKNLTEAQKDAINAKYDAKARAIKQAAWKKQHNADLLQAIVGTALGVTKAIPNIPLMIAAGIAGGLQIAVIASQKMPEFYEGGFTAMDSSNKTPAGIVHANEYVIPEQGVNNPKLRPFINAIEVARQNKSLPRLNPALFEMAAKGGFSGGGFTSKSGNSIKDVNGSSAVGSDLNIWQTEAIIGLKSTVENLNKILSNGIESTVAIRGRNGLYEKMEEDKQSRKNASL